MHQLLARLMAARTATHRQTPAPVVPPGGVVRECPDIAGAPGTRCRATATRRQSGLWDVWVHAGMDPIVIDLGEEVPLAEPSEIIRQRGWRITAGWWQVGDGWAANVERGW